MAQSAEVITTTKNDTKTVAKPSTGSRPAIDSVNIETMTLPEVNVNAEIIKDQRIDRTQAITTVSSLDLQRLQPISLFEAIRDVPGVAISGGPRPSGMTFNVRGYTDNQDVAVKVDGISKGFEKYRFGGTFIEPELLKSIQVQRGPQITSGSGSLGGTIVATTKDAADLLAPGQTYGARAKTGYANNNDEFSRSFILYGRPDERVDILYSFSKRTSNNITRPDGTPLLYSTGNSGSELLKFSLFPTDNLSLTTSVVSFQDTGLQPYDASDGLIGDSFGNVIRSIDDLTWSETIAFKPDSKWIDLKAIVGSGHTNLRDYFKRPASTYFSPSYGVVIDQYQYETTTIDISNTARILNYQNLNISVLAGFQYNKNVREVTRVTENTAVNNDTYPNGFNPQVPPGTKTSTAFYLQPRLEWQGLSIVPGIRFDQYKVKAAGGTLDLLAPYNQPSEITLDETTYSLGLAYDLVPKRLTLFSNYGQGFRPPLIDQYFSKGGVVPNCQAYFMPNGPQSQMCGDLYKPQTSDSIEVGVSYQTPHFLDSEAQFTAKLTLYNIVTKQLLTSLGETTSGEIVQRGVEIRNGLELESTLQYKAVYGRVSYSSISGEINQDVRRNGSPRLYNATESIPLYTVPGDAFTLTLGAQLFEKLEANINYRNVAQRVIRVSGGSGTTPSVFGIQNGYDIINAGLHFALNKNLGFHFIGENLTNQLYNLDGGFAGSIGLVAPGRNLRFVAEVAY